MIERCIVRNTPFMSTILIFCSLLTRRSQLNWLGERERLSLLYSKERERPWKRGFSHATLLHTICFEKSILGTTAPSLLLHHRFCQLSGLHLQIMFHMLGYLKGALKAFGRKQRNQSKAITSMTKTNYISLWLIIISVFQKCVLNLR
jgi:hypothetical protein